MPLRTKLLLFGTLSLAASVAAVAWLIEARTREAFRVVNQQRTEALVAQFRAEFSREGEEIISAVTEIANSGSALEIALKFLNGAGSEKYEFHDKAASLAATHHLDFLDLLAPDGTILSSAHWDVRFGYKQRWFLREATPSALTQRPFLHQVETPPPEGNVLAILCIRTVQAHGEDFYVMGGRALNKALLQSLATPAGMRILIYNSPEQGSSAFLSSTSDSFDADKLKLLAETALQQPQMENSSVIQWSTGSQEIFHAMALPSLGSKPAAALLVGNSLAQQQELETRIEKISLWIALLGTGFGLVLSSGIATHITRPVKALAGAAGEIAGGNWKVHVEPTSNDEIGRLAQAFNHMTQELIAQKERLVQAERVAAWRELARRLAHELKNPLFPLQLTVENLLRAREAGPQQFEEVFQESTSTLLAEIANLKTIIGRFSDFSKMPAPQLEPLDLNEMVRSVVQLFRGQLQSQQASIETVMDLASLPPVNADPVLLRRVLENLVLNAIDAMPQGGRLTFRTLTVDKYAVLELSDTGIGLTPEECERLFTPYYTSKQHGTGLGLAIVQSVISDHKGTITVRSKKAEGTTFHIELPLHEESGGELTPMNANERILG